MANSNSNKIKEKANVQVNKSTLMKFTILSGKSGIPRKDLIEDALNEYLKKHYVEEE